MNTYVTLSATTKLFLFLPWKDEDQINNNSELLDFRFSSDI